MKFSEVVIILGTPLIFIARHLRASDFAAAAQTWTTQVMAMRSLIRIWTVMAGTAFRGGTPWEDMERLEIATRATTGMVFFWEV